MELTVQRASFADLHRIEEIYANARAFMAANGNPTQWGTSYPETEMLRSDISQGKLYLIRKDSRIRGVFYFGIDDDSTYHVIDGSWHSEAPYGVIHRIAGEGSGILAAAVAYGSSIVSYLRIDTHADNHIMQRAIAKQGFSYCGIIHVEDGTPRFAYDRIS